MDQSFNPIQYESLVSLVNEMILQVTSEHRVTLDQLQKTKQFQESMSNTSNILSQSLNTNESIAFDELPSPFSSKQETAKSKQPLNLNETYR